MPLGCIGGGFVVIHLSLQRWDVVAIRGKEPENTKKIFQRSCICKHKEEEGCLQTNSIISCLCLYVEQGDVQYMTHLDYNSHFREQLAQFLCCIGPPDASTDALVIITELTNDILLDHTLTALQARGVGYGIFSGRWPLHVAITEGGKLTVIDKEFVRFKKPKEASECMFGLELYSRLHLKCSYLDPD